MNSDVFWLGLVLSVYMIWMIVVLAKWRAERRLSAMKDEVERLAEEAVMAQEKALKGNKVWKDLKGQSYRWLVGEKPDGGIVPPSPDIVQAAFLQEIRDNCVATTTAVSNQGPIVERLDRIANQLAMQNKIMARIYGIKEKDLE